jgi:UDP-galactopyranose mutase
MNIDITNYDVIIVGAGLSGAVMAEQFATRLDKKILVVEKRDHVGGNCYDYIDSDTGIRISKYGPHFFHTNDEVVWKYINKYSEWIRYDLKYLANVDNRLVPVPVNMETINILCGTNLQNETQVDEWLNTNRTPYENPDNSEQVALSRVGSILYEKMFLPYTIKQWNRHPKYLDPSVLSRIPVRNGMESRYFSDKYQAIPKLGYTHFFENIFKNPNIDVFLNTNIEIIDHPCVIYTGPIDSYFKNANLPKLEYRSLKFETIIHKNIGYFQQNIAINTPSLDFPYHRTIEYKHLPYECNSKSNDTIIVREYPSDIGEPYYPVPTKENQQVYEKYKLLANNIEKKGVHMVGRLANYKYFNMDQAIRNALDYFEAHFITSKV